MSDVFYNILLFGKNIKKDISLKIYEYMNIFIKIFKIYEYFYITLYLF